MSVISFTYDDTNSVYVNTLLQDGSIILLPPSYGPRNIVDYDDITGDVDLEDQEVAHIDNQDSTNRSVEDTVYINQQTVGDVVIRGMVKAIDVPGSKSSTFSLISDIRHQDVTFEYGQRIEFPTGKFNWAQFSKTLTSAALKTIGYVYPNYRLRDRTGEAYFKAPEVYNLNDIGVVDPVGYGEAYSTPECLFEPVELFAGKKQMGIDMMAFAYGALENLNEKGSPAHAIEVLSQYPYLICEEPGTMSDKDLYVTDAIKDTVEIFGYIAMGGDPLPDLADLELIIDRIAAAGWYGVFVDQFGYDFDETRARQNTLIDYIHDAGLIAFVNAWFVDDALGSTVDVDSNPDGSATHLTTGDWYLMESFLMSESGYRTNLYDSLTKYNKCVVYKESLGVNMACLSYKRSATEWGDADTDADIILSYMMAALFGFDGWWFADELSEDKFSHAEDPDIDLGNSLELEFEQLFPYWYIAETDRYLIVFDAESYSPLTYTVYDKTRRRELPTTTGEFEYSADLDTWSSSASGAKWVREKLTYT